MSRGNRRWNLASNPSGTVAIEGYQAHAGGVLTTPVPHASMESIRRLTPLSFSLSRCCGPDNDILYNILGSHAILVRCHAGSPCKDEVRIHSHVFLARACVS